MRIRTLIALVVAATVGVTAPAMAATVSPGTFSIAHRTVHRSPAPAPAVTAIRVGHHATYDRIVVQLRGSSAPGFDVRYVSTLTADPSGKTVNLLGPTSLQIVLNPANAHSLTSGHSTLTTPEHTKWRLDQVRETAVLGDFEAVFTLGVGLDHRAPFRVLTLHNPTRIVVDVRH